MDGNGHGDGILHLQRTQFLAAFYCRNASGLFKLVWSLE
jgi:hypothetical protein